MSIQFGYTRKFLAISMIAAGAVWNASAQTYPAPVVQGPSSNPAFPSGFAAFDAPLHSNPLGSGVPEIAEWTRGNNGGDTMALTGYNLGSDFVFYSSAGGLSAGTVELLDGMEAAVKLPQSVGSKSFALIWNGNGSGYGRPAPINGTEAWWVGPKRATRGQTFSVFGENLGMDGTCHLYIDGYGWIESDSANPYKADFTVPSGLANGTYTVWAHNGQGRQYGWGAPLTLEVYNGLQWSDNSSNWIYVQRDYGATGDGTTDDSAAIKSALAAADGSSGKTVYFEPGTYRINSSIVDSLTDVRIKGAGVNETKLVERVGGLGADLLDLNADRCEISDMTIETDPGSLSNKNLLDLSGSEDLVLRRLVVSQLPNAANSPAGGDPVALPEEYLIRMIDCIFHVGKPLLIKNSDQIFVEGCQFYAINDANSVLSFGVASDVSIVNSTCGHYDFSAGVEFTGAGRFVLCNPGKGAPRNWYYAGNETVDFTTHTDNNNHNAAEDFMFESTDTEWYGTPTGVNGDVLTFASLPSSVEGNNMYWVDYTATIVAGKGLGQARTVVDYDTGAGTLTLDEPFRVQPDDTSVLYFGFFARNIVVYDSIFDGNWDRVNHSDDPADAGVETYGGSHRLIVDSNTITDKETAFYVHCRARPTVFAGENTPPPNYFGVYKNNVCTNIQTAARLIATEHNQHLGDPISPGVGHIGHVFRKNHFRNVTEQAWHYEWRQSNPGMTLLVFDGNTADGYADDVGFYAVHNGTESDSPPSMIKNQVQVEAYLVEASEPPPPDGPPAPVLTGIAISGPTSINEETSAQYTCTATYSDGSTATVSPDWSENSGYASISGSGVLSAGDVSANQNVTIMASFGGQTDTHSVTINYVAPVLTGITISGPTSLDEETKAQYSCTATYSDGTSATVTPSWSENSSYASISVSGVLSAGNVTSSQGVTITASYGGKTDTHNVTINYVAPVLTGITISGPTSLDEQTTAQYSCMATYSDGTSATVTPNWSENSSYASINVSGVLSAGEVSASQSVTITASFGGRTDTHNVTINYVTPVLTGITISGPNSLDEETTAQYSCTATYSDGTSATVTPSWNENSSYASISVSGLLSAGDVDANQSVTITANFGGRTDTHSVTINYVAPVLTGITISGPASLDEETTAQYSCTATYSDGSSATVTPSWGENSSYASISVSGVLSAGNVTSSQGVTITASYGGKTDTHSVTILFVEPPVEVTGISITGPSTLEENTTGSFTCTASYSDGTSEVVTPIWSENASFASINASGVLSAGNIESDSSVTVSASFDGFTASRTVDVWMVGTQVIYPLSGFEGKTVWARLWDETAQEWHDLGEMEDPSELVIENVNPDQWYWVSIKEFDDAAGQWVMVQSNWISM